MESPFNYRFWASIGKWGWLDDHLPAVLQADDKGLTCTYVPEGSTKPTQLFKLTWNEIKSRYYADGRPTDYFYIMTSNQKFVFARLGGKNFPESLVALSPQDNGFNKMFMRPNKILVELENLLKAHNIPAYKPSFKQRMFGI